MSKLSNKAKIDLILQDLENWMYGSDSDGSLEYAFHNGFRLHAASLWIGTGAMSEEVEKQVKGVKISRRAEMKEIKQLCEEAHIYICPDCNHHAFLDNDEGEAVSCSSCLKTAIKKKKGA